MTALEIGEVEVREDPAHYVTWTLTSGGIVRVGFSAIVYGFAAVETSGSASATVNFYDGTDTTGALVLPVNLAQSESVVDWYNRGIWFKNAVFINMGSGQAKGTLFFRHYRR